MTRATGFSRGMVLPLLAAVACGAWLAWPRVARACGGFFCSQTPVDQSGEQIVFALEPGRVTAHIQISYKGEAKDFAWVVPVLSKPEIKLGSQAVFTQVGGRTQPQFNIDWGNSTGQCFLFGRGVLDGMFPAPAPSADTSVVVIEQKEVGPYNTVVLESNDSAELTAWLANNGYDQPPEAAPIIDYYVRAGMLFVALKLKQDASVGDIQPIVLSMDNPEACVPLILTQVAALPDMPVSVYVLGEARAFPKNWFHVVIDETKINWWNGGQNYRQIVTSAIDEAAGHGFVTEFAGKSSIMKQALYREGQWDLTALAGITDPAVLIQTLLRMGFPRDAVMQSLLRKYIPMPDSVRARGVSESQFYNNIGQYRADLLGFVLDTAGFVMELDERIVTPLKDAQAMFDAQPYLTRLLSTVSPPEMTRDPLFLQNPDLPDVSNIHTLKADGMCENNGQVSNLTLTFADGDTLFIPGPVTPYGNTAWTYADDKPAAKRIELVPPRGTPARYTRGQAVVADMLLNSQDPATVRARSIPEPGPITMPPPKIGVAAGGGGCSVGGERETSGLFVVFVGLGLAWTRTRRRRSRH